MSSVPLSTGRLAGMRGSKLDPWLVTTRKRNTTSSASSIHAYPVFSQRLRRTGEPHEVAGEFDWGCGRFTLPKRRLIALFATLIVKTALVCSGFALPVRRRRL